MTDNLTPWARALSDLTEALSAIAADNDLQGEDWLLATFAAFAQTPLLEHLDPFLYEMLLGWGGFDLAKEAGIRCAAFVTSMLVGAGLVSFPTGPGLESTAAVVLARTPEYEPYVRGGAEFRASPDGIGARAIAERRCAEYFRAWLAAEGPATAA